MFEITIQRLGHKGDGIGRGLILVGKADQEGPIYAPLTLPGEKVEGDVVGDRMPSPKILRPSSDRVSPPCRYFKRCGGCAMQHASDGLVEAWKASIIKDALKAHGLPAPLRHFESSPPRTRRRAVFSGRRLKKGAMVGFHMRGSDQLVDLEDCHLVLPELMGVFPALKDLIALGGSRKSELSLFVTWMDGGADVSVGPARPDDKVLLQAASVAHQQNLARLSWGGELVVERRVPTVQFDGITVRPPPGPFLQATAHGENALRSAVSETVSGASKVIDLFAGCGTFALPLVKTAEVHAVESDRAALDAMDHAWRHADGLRKLTTEARDLYRRPLVPMELKADALVIDPPRAGAEAQIAEVAQSDVPVVAMVSCNPLTFARDAKVLTQAGYTLNWIDIVDQFRWSSHIELVASFTR